VNADRPLVAIARRLLDSGLRDLRDRFDVREGRPDISRVELLGLVRGAAAIVSDPTVPVDGELLDAAGFRLAIVANLAVGYDNVDVEACRKRGVIVTNTPGALTNATAELAVALTLAAARLLGEAERDLRERRWTGWDPIAYRGLELTGATVGVVGLGRIGRRYGELLRGFDAELLYTGPSRRLEAEAELGARHVALDELLRASDVVSIHAPLRPETRGLIGAAQLALMKPAAVLVNTSRGPLVDAAALARALREGRLGAAGLDVYDNEPQVPPELLESPRLVLLPHIGSATTRARDEMSRLVAANVIAALDGEDPPNRVA